MVVGRPWLKGVFVVWYSIFKCLSLALIHSEYTDTTYNPYNLLASLRAGSHLRARARTAKNEQISKAKRSGGAESGEEARITFTSLKMVQFEPITPNVSQHIATRWPNAHNMLRPTVLVLRYVALVCCLRQRRAAENLANVISYVSFFFRIVGPRLFLRNWILVM